uniref:Uncharacterized protein n=1 Tax=Panagrolaimus sp. JU765 TaxID=591449 RepID=A0AC34QEE2_9BILA
MEAAIERGDLKIDDEGHAHLTGIEKNIVKESDSSIKSPARFAEQGIIKAEEEEKIIHVKEPSPMPTPPSHSPKIVKEEQTQEDDDEEEEESDEASSQVATKSTIPAKTADITRQKSPSKPKEESNWSDDDEFLDPSDGGNKTGHDEDINLDDLDFDEDTKAD